MSTLAEDLQSMQEHLLMELVKTKAKLEAVLETCDAFNILDVDIVELRAQTIEEEMLAELMGEDDEEDVDDAIAREHEHTGGEHERSGHQR